jgi:hypothetical protein
MHIKRSGAAQRARCVSENVEPCRQGAGAELSGSLGWQSRRGCVQERPWAKSFVVRLAWAARPLAVSEMSRHAKLCGAGIQAGGSKVAFKAVGRRESGSCRKCSGLQARKRQRLPGLGVGELIMQGLAWHASPGLAREGGCGSVRQQVRRVFGGRSHVSPAQPGAQADPQRRG